MELVLWAEYAGPLVWCCTFCSTWYPPVDRCSFPVMVPCSNEVLVARVPGFCLTDAGTCPNVGETLLLLGVGSGVSNLLGSKGVMGFWSFMWLCKLWMPSPCFMALAGLFSICFLCFLCFLSSLEGFLPLSGEGGYGVGLPVFPRAGS